MVSAGRAEVVKDREMSADFASVRNSTGFEIEAVPIMMEQSIGDSVSAIISFGKIYLLSPIDRTIKRLKVAVEMKPA